MRRSRDRVHQIGSEVHEIRGEVHEWMSSHWLIVIESALLVVVGGLAPTPPRPIRFNHEPGYTPYAPRLTRHSKFPEG